MAKLSVPNFPYVEASHQGGKQKPTVVVIRLSFTTSEEGAAFAIANNWHRRSSPSGPSHYVVDEANIFRCVPDRIVATIPGTIEITVCAQPTENLFVWDEGAQANAMEQTATLLASLMAVYNIPAVYLNEIPKHSWLQRKLRSCRGIKLNVAGVWPELSFLSNVESQMATLKGW